MKKWFTAFLLLVLVLCVACIASAEKNGWEMEESYICYYKNDVKVTGTQTIDGNVYYFTDDGNLKGNNAIQHVYYGDYFLDENNKVVVGWKTIGSKKYYFRPEKATGTYAVDGIKYAFKYDGQLLINEWDWNNLYGDKEGKILVGYKTVEEKNYLFSDDGIAQTGFHEINGKIHYFNPEEAFGWWCINGELYYFDPDTGVMQTTARTIDGTAYTFENNGRLNHSEKVVVKFNDGVWCGYSENNELLEGWQTINGSKYYFNSHFNDQWKIIFGANIGMKDIFNAEKEIYEYFYFDDNGKMKTNYWYKSESGDNKYIYYFGSDGIRVKGWQTIDGEKYYFNDYAYVGNHGIGESYYYFDEDGKMQKNLFIKHKDRWYDENDGLFYYGADGKRVSGWQTIDGEKYYFGDAAYIGMQSIINEESERNYYYFDEEGKMKTNYWHKYETDDGKYIYYFGSDGKRVNGWQTIDGEKYYFENSAYIGNRYIINEKGVEEYYYFDNDGKMQKNLLIKHKRDRWSENDELFYYGTDGKRVNGWQTIDGEKYFFGDAAYIGMQSVLNEDGKSEYYYFDEDGKMKTNYWYKYETYDGKYTYYYFGFDGKCVNGWQTIDGEKYYFRNGTYIGMQTVLNEDGKREYYYFDEDGKMKTNYLYKYESDDNKYIYYFGSDGKRVEGWQTIDGEKYYFSSSAFTGANYISNENLETDYYYFDNDGKMQKNLLIKHKQTWGDSDSIYYYGADGKRISGWKTIDGEKYFFDLYNGAYTGTHTINDLIYTFSEDGKLQETVIPVKSISLNKSNLNLAVGESETLTVTINPDDATNKKVKWSSSEPNVVKVDANGKVTAVGVGEASVYITSDYNGERYAYCYVYVEEAVRGDINLDGLIDGRDVIHFMKWLAQEDDVEIVESAADVNKDGKTDEKDLLVLMQYLGGQIEKLP